MKNLKCKLMLHNWKYGSDKWNNSKRNRVCLECGKRQKQISIGREGGCMAWATLDKGDLLI